MVFLLDTRTLPKLRYMNRNTTRDGWKHFSRVAEEYILYIVTRGDMYLEEAGERCCLQAGDALLLEPGKRHQGYRESSCEYYYAHCAPDSFTPLEMDAEQLADCLEARRRSSNAADLFEDEGQAAEQLWLPKRIHLDSVNLQAAVASMQRAMNAFDSRTDHFRLVCTLQFMEILLRMSRQYAQELLGGDAARACRIDGHVAKLLDYLNANYTQKLSSGNLAEQMGMNYDYLNRIFKRQMGMTIFKYVDMLRVNKAKELLHRGGLRSREIAEAVGYSDEYRFSKAFKRAEGHSPKRRK